MSETTQDQRDYVKGLADQVVNDSVPLSRRLAYGLALDADRLAQYERQCIPRTDGMPEDAVGWFKGRNGFPFWVYVIDDSFIGPCRVESRPPVAPDLVPDEPGPLYRHIVDVE